jgi:hypothetical protein
MQVNSSAYVMHHVGDVREYREMCIKFGSPPEETRIRTYEMNQDAFREPVMSRTQVYD